MTDFPLLYPNWHSQIQSYEGLSSCIICRPNKTHLSKIKATQSSIEQVLKEEYAITQVQWLKQVHGNRVIAAPQSEIAIGDACYTKVKGLACIVRTADCLPVFLCNQPLSQIALIHAGWRSLALGIIAKTVATFSSGDRLYAAFGPAISVSHYEVGEDVYSSFDDKTAFIPIGNNKWQLDLYSLAANQLEEHNICCGPKPDWCTYKQATKFYSHRREGLSSSPYDRIANCIWLK